MQPTATYNPVLSQVVAEYASGLSGQFMGTKLMPFLNVDKDEGTLPALDIDNVTKSTSNAKRAPGAGYDRIQSKTTSVSYQCYDFGLEEPQDDSDRRRLNQFGLGEQSDIVNNIALHVMRQQEKRISTLLFSETTFSGYTGNASGNWATIATKIRDDVQGKILSLKQALGGAIGTAEICLAVSETVFLAMQKNTQLLAQLPGGGGSENIERNLQQVMSARQMAIALGINNVFYSCAQDDGSDIWSANYALLFLRHTGPRLKMAPQLGRTFLWTEDSPTPYVAESYREEKVRSDVYRVRHNVDETVLTTKAGYLLKIAGL